MTITNRYVIGFGRFIVYFVIVSACLGIWYAIYGAAKLFFGW